MTSSETRRIVLAGVSRGSACGVRDHTAVLVRALSDLCYNTQVVWEDLNVELNPGEVMRSLSRWRQSVATQSLDADLIILQYSVFSHSYRGIPVGNRQLGDLLRRANCPVIGYLHEFAYPWRGGPREWVWAITQRISLRSLLRGIDRVALTSVGRMGMVGRRPWFPRRPTVFAPISSTLAPPSCFRTAERSGGPASRLRVGIFGYGSEQSEPQIAVQSLKLLWNRGFEVDYIMMGAPGPTSRVAALWLGLAREVGVEDCIEFTGIIAANELAEQIVACEVAFFCFGGGADGRRTSIANCLVLGVPLVAFGGAESWAALESSGAVRTAAKDPVSVADAVGDLLESEAARLMQVERGNVFYAAELEPVTVAQRLVRDLIA